MISLNTFLVIAAFALVFFVIAIVAFHQMLKRIDGLTLENRISAWEVFAKVITIVTATVAGLLAFVRYADQRELELAAGNLAAAQSVREFNLKIYGEAKSTDQAKRVLLNEAADLVSTLATLDDLESPMGRITLNRFERLYHGQLVLYENKKVETAMVNFRNALLKWQRTGKRPDGMIPADDGHSGDIFISESGKTDFLRQLALRLSNACKLELKILDGEEPEAKNPCDGQSPAAHTEEPEKAVPQYESKEFQKQGQ